jgi:NAD(P)-dependent dehydrogenase (short-subunit alcohol dehydrogenase family)
MREFFSLKGSVALVTGGSRGIGKAIAIGLAEQGADIAILSRNSEQSQEVAQYIRELGRRSMTVCCDVSEIVPIETAIQSVEKELGGIDILVNSAGTHVKVDSITMTPEQWDNVLNTNLKGLFFVCQSVGKRMANQGGGTIINIASINGIVPFPDILAYSVSKAGVISLGKSLAADWAKYGIRVNTIAPGAIPTDLNREALKTPGRKEAIIAKTPLNRMGTVDDIVGAVIYLASSVSSFTTGATIVIDGGLLVKGI